MKVLFAVTSDSISEAIVKKYQREYKEILSYKNVYYFDAIFKEIQKDKSYDRIVISEDLEAFTNMNYDAIDKKIFEKLDSISDEAQDIDGNETSIILICADRRTKGSSFLIKLFSIGIYNALLGSERSMEQVCKLINKPRVKKEAKFYYGVDSEDANYNSINIDEVSELEIQNILNHFKRLGKNTDKYVESFNNIAQQYTDDQLKIVINCLPSNVKSVLERGCKKYQEVLSIKGIISQSQNIEEIKEENRRQTGIKIDLIENKKSQKMSGPIVIPGSVRTSKNKGPVPVRPQGNNIDSSVVGKTVKSEKVVKQQATKSIASVTQDKVKPVVKQQKTVGEKTAPNVVKQVKPQNESVVPVKKQPKKVTSTEGLIKKVKPDGTVVYVRPKVKVANESTKQEEKSVEKVATKATENTENKITKQVVEDKNELDDLVLPKTADFDTNDLVLPEKNNELDDLELPDIELDEEKNDISPMLDEEDDDLILPSKNDDFDDFDDIDIPTLDDFDSEGNEIVKEKEIEVPESDEDEIDLSSLEENSEEDNEEELELPALEDEEELELPVLEDDEDELELPTLEDDEEELELPALEDDEDEMKLPALDDFEEDFTDEVDIPGLDAIDDFNIDESSDLGVVDMLPEEEPLVTPNFENTQTSNQEIESVKPKIDYSMSSLNSLLTKDKKIVSFIGTTKNGTSFLINNLAALFSSLGISTAILDMTKNRNSYYIYTNNDENLRNIAFNSMSKLQKGFAEGIKVDKNLTVYSALPNDGKDYSDAEPILSTLVQNHSLILIDCDFDTNPSYFASCQEIYLVQSMDILTIQPLTSFLRDLKAQGVLEAEKVRVVINKEIKVRSLSTKAILGGMSFYNDPSMSFMTELFNKDMVKCCSIPFEDNVYSKYLDAMVNCNLSLNGYSKQFMNKLRILGDMVYPLVSKSSLYGSAKSQVNTAPKFGKTSFSKDTNNTLNQMKKKI